MGLGISLCKSGGIVEDRIDDVPKNDMSGRSPPSKLVSPSTVKAFSKRIWHSLIAGGQLSRANQALSFAAWT